MKPQIHNIGGSGIFNVKGGVVVCVGVVCVGVVCVGVVYMVTVTFSLFFYIGQSNIVVYL